MRFSGTTLPTPRGHFQPYQLEGQLGEHHAGELRHESAKAKAERIVQEELKRLGWNPGL